MTDCAKIQELISALLDGELSAEEDALIKEHIESCTECAQMYEMFALVSGELQSDMAEAPADLKDKVMEGIKPAKKKKGIIVSLRPYMTAAACLVLVIGIFAAGRGGFSMNSASDTAASRSAPESYMADAASPAEAPMTPMAPMEPMAPEDDSYSYSTTGEDYNEAETPEEQVPESAEDSNGNPAALESDTDGSANWEEPDRSGIKYYCLDKDSEHTSPTVALYASGEFSIIFSDLSSYIATGTYEIANDRLTLNTVEGTVYVFDIMSDSIVFDADASTGYGFDDGDVLEGA